MFETMNVLIAAVFIGIGASIAMDLWGILRQRLLGVPPLDYALVGRWLAHLPRGRFRHHPIGATPAVKGEHTLGWIAHYLIGIAFVALLLSMWGSAWLRHPTLGPALIVGLSTVLLPFLLMQPAMGAGIAASRTPRPWTARVHSVLTHGVFGLGLYVTGCLWRLI
jgi:hypothetical protein